jgi:hypothetical protein
MSEETEEVMPESAATERPAVQEGVKDVTGRGKWDGKTGRYIPMGGGSRSRVPISDDPEIPRYPGMMGIDPDQGEGIQTISALYSHLGGVPVVKPGKASKFLGEILERRPKIDDDPLAI